MIRFEKEKWCENCPEFEPNVEKQNLYSDDYCINGNFRKKIVDTVITCKHRDRCQDMINYLIRAFRNGDIK